jgi:putative Holliday junction resolvase
MPRILAVDYGLRRIGLAHSDSNKKFAFPLKNILIQDFFKEISEILEAGDYEAVLFGIPMRKDGTEGDLAVEIRKVADKLKSKHDVEILFFDETLSSKAAEDIIISQDLSFNKRQKKRKQKLDSLAAAHFLQNYLDKF